MISGIERLGIIRSMTFLKTLPTNVTSVSLKHFPLVLVLDGNCQYISIGLRISRVSKSLLSIVKTRRFIVHRNLLAKENREGEENKANHNNESSTYVEKPSEPKYSGTIAQTIVEGE